MKVVLGSTNNEKVAIVTQKVNEILGVEPEIVALPIQSGVAEAPWDEDAIRGARNRAHRSLERFADADLAVGIESGLVERWGIFFEETWAIMVDARGNEYVGYSSGLVLPDYVVSTMKEQNLTHDAAMRYIDSSLGNESSAASHDTWHTYTGGALRRAVGIEEAVRNALLQIKPTKNSLYAFTNGSKT